MSIIYLAGPMRGIPYYNFPAFDRARDELMKKGFGVTSPADMDREHGFDALKLPPDSDWDSVPKNFDFDACVRRDMEAVRACDKVYALTGWSGSKGARAELAFAEWIGKPVYYQGDSMQEMFNRPIEGPDKAAALAAGMKLLGKPTFDDGDDGKPAKRPPSKEVMTANEKTGGMKGSKPNRFDLMPAKALWELAYHYGINVTDHGGKYPPNNWRKGFDWSKAFAAIQRHSWQFWGGEDIDEESGSKHMIAVAFHALALATWMDDHKEFDDRWKGMNAFTPPPA